MRRALLCFIIIICSLLLYVLFGAVSTSDFLKSAGLIYLICIGPLNLLCTFQSTLRLGRSCSIGLLILFLFDAAIKSFLYAYYGLAPEAAMVLQSVFNTTSGEVGDFLMQNIGEIVEQVALFLAITLVGIVSLQMMHRGESARASAQDGCWMRIAGVLGTLILIALHFNPTMRNANPVAFWMTHYREHKTDLASFRKMQSLMKNNAANLNAWTLRDEAGLQRTVILIIGESANRDNWSLYGYPRNTTPKLDALRKEIVVFRDVISPAAFTQDALKMLLTPATIEHPDRWQTYPDVLMVAKSEGYKTFWLSNQTQATSADSFVSIITESADVKTFTNQGGRNVSPQDTILLPHVNAALADPSPLKFIVVHLWGQHFNYANRYPTDAAVFVSTEDGVAQAMRAAGRSEAIIARRNEYDNAVRYGDYVLGALIAAVAKVNGAVPTALVYVSDHGQEVGHHRDFSGHSANDETGYTVPLFFWSNAAYGAFAADKETLEARPYQTDKMDTTLLDVLKIHSKNERPEYSLLDLSFAPFPRKINGQRYQMGQPLRPLLQ